MIVVKVELHSAITGKVTMLAQAIIHNVGTREQGKKGDYRVVVAKKGHFDFRQMLKKPLREGSVEDYPRLSYNVWRLVIRGLLSAFPEETSRR